MSSEFLNNMLNSGEIVKGRVHRVETFGLYLEYQNYNLFVRIIDVSWGYREHKGLIVIASYAKGNGVGLPLFKQVILVGAILYIDFQKKESKL
jgi:hypothetical protein